MSLQYHESLYTCHVPAGTLLSTTMITVTFLIDYQTKIQLLLQFAIPITVELVNYSFTAKIQKLYLYTQIKENHGYDGNTVNPHYNDIIYSQDVAIKINLLLYRIMSRLVC